MEYYAGLDVSLKSTHICVMSQDGQVVWGGTAVTQPSMIAERLRSWKGHLAKVGLETGSLTPWLYHELKGLGFPIICMDARRAADALKARPEKTDKADAQALAEMLVSGWYDAAMGNGIKRQHEPPRSVDDLLESRDRRKAGTVHPPPAQYRPTAARKDIEAFDFADTPVGATFVRELPPAPSSPISTMSSLSAVPERERATSPSPLPKHSFACHTRRFFNVVDPINQLEVAARSGKQGRTVDYLLPDFIILDELA